MANAGPVTIASTTAVTSAGAEEIAIGLPNLSPLEALETEYKENPEDPDLKKYADDVYTNAWSPGVVDYMNEISNECVSHSRMHAQTTMSYERKHQIVTISLIILPFIGTILIIIPFAGTFQKVAGGILNALGILVGSLNKVMKFADKAKVHRLASDKYMTLNSEIADQSSLLLKSRYNGIMFLRFIRKQFFALKRLAPYPDKQIQWIWNRSNSIKENASKPLLATPTALPDIVVIPNIPPVQGSPNGDGNGGEEIPLQPIDGSVPPVQNLPPPSQPAPNAWEDYIMKKGRIRFQAEHDS